MDTPRFTYLSNVTVGRAIASTDGPTGPTATATELPSLSDRHPLPPCYFVVPVLERCGASVFHTPTNSVGVQTGGGGCLGEDGEGSRDGFLEGAKE
jgi:hypothetical protein